MKRKHCIHAAALSELTGFDCQHWHLFAPPSPTHTSPHAHTVQAAGVLPSVSPVSPDVGMQLPACQPAARLEANQEAALDCAQADAGKRPQAQQIEATPGQANDQQVRYPAYGDGAKLPLSCNDLFCEHFTLDC